MVTIKSADSAHDATLSTIRIANSSNFTFNDVDVHRPLVAGEKDFTQAVYVSGSKGISFVGVDFTGSMDNNAWNDGVGLRIASSSNVNLVDSTFAQWTNAALFDTVTGLLVAGNSVREVREGFDFVQVTNVTVDRNYFTAFQPNFAAGDHADSMQFWNTGATVGSSHVTISDNVMLHGASGGVQGIFIASINPQLRFSDFTITNNLYNGDSRHGITLSATDGAVVRGNTVTSAPGGMLESGLNIGGSTNVVVDKNLAPLLLDNGGNKAVTWSNNVDLWDSHTKVGVTLASVFSGSATGTNVADYAVKAGSGAAALHSGFTAVDGIGAALFDLSHHAAYANLDAQLLPLVA